MRQFNIYEEDEPTKKEAKKAVKDVKGTAVTGETRPETIDFEKGLAKKTPKKKYFGGATRPEDVDTKAAIKSHSDDIKAAGQAAVKKAQEKRDAEDKAAQQAEAYRALGRRLDEFLGAVVKVAGPALKKTGTMAAKGAKKAGQTAVKGAKELGKEAAHGAGEAMANKAMEREELNQSTQYNNAYVTTLMEAAGEGATAQERKADRERAEKDRNTRRAATKAAETKTLPTDDAAAGLMGLSIRKPKPVKDWIEYRRLGKLVIEWKAGPIAQRIEKQSPGGEGSRMSDQGDKPVSRDPLVAAETKKTVKNVDKKLSDLASPKDSEGNIVKGKEKKVKTDMKTADVVQGSMNRRRKEPQTPLPPLSKADSRALGEREREMPGDKERASRARRRG